MSTITVTLPLTPAYDRAYQQLLCLDSTKIDVAIEIQEGSHAYITSFQRIGTFKYFAVPELEAAIRISYTYDATAGVLELYGNDHISDQSTCILLRSANTELGWQQNTHAASPYLNASDSTWPFSPQYTPGLWDILRNSVRTANDRFIAAATTFFPIVRVHTPPPVLSTVEDINKWMVMTAIDGTYLGIFDATKVYPEGATMVDYLQSTWGGIVSFNKNENIANVIGSSKDPKISSLPWIELWERDYGMEDRCTSHNWASGKAFVCNDAKQQNRVGGHVVSGKTPKAVKAGSDAVYIIPICKAHNGNDNVYMRADVYTQGVWLKDYNK